MGTDGRIINLVPKRPYTVRLSDTAQSALDEIGRLMGVDNSAAFDLAVRHLYGTLLREEPLRLRQEYPGLSEEKTA